MNQQKNQQKNQTKQNYQKILDRTIEELQQLCTGVSVGVFSNYGVILQPEYLSG